MLYRVGGRMPLHSTGVGLILLAHAPAPVQDEILAGDLTLEPEHIRLSRRDLRTRLAAIRRDGVAVASRRHPEPMTSVACPVTDQRHRTVAALSVVTRPERLEPAAVRPAVVAVARAISRAPSHRRGGPASAMTTPLAAGRYRGTGARVRTTAAPSPGAWRGRTDVRREEAVDFGIICNTGQLGWPQPGHAVDWPARGTSAFAARLGLRHD